MKIRRDILELIKRKLDIDISQEKLYQQIIKNNLV